MTKFYLSVFIALALTSCSANTSTDNPHVDTIQRTSTVQQKNDMTSNLLADTLKVKQWLTNVIESYTNSENPKTAFENLRHSLTNNYCNYKQDAINLEYGDGDTPMSEEAFKKKWQDKYNIKFVGNGGFIISAQDNGKIKVTSCNFLKNLGQNASIYKVVIEDLDYKTKFNRDIKVIAQNGKLLIDDIIEYD